MSQESKVAIVTGGARGIGLEICRELLAAGMKVIAADVNDALFADAVNSLGNPDESTFVCRKLDVTDSEGFAALAAEVAEKFGSIDVLVNNAGITRDGLVMRMSDDDWSLVQNVNLSSAFYGTRAVSKFMVRQKSGSIINISSYSGIAGNPGQANYAASKAGMIGLTKTVARELAGKGIRCNAIAPGFIQTEMTDAISEKAREAALSMIPMKKMGLPIDVAKAVRFLAADDSGYISGQTISVDGAMRCQ